MRNAYQAIYSYNKDKYVQVTMMIQIWVMVGQDIDGSTEV